MKKRFSILVGAILALATTGFSYPTLFGPTGGAALPTADTTPRGQLDIAADYYSTSGDKTYPIRATISTGAVEFGGLYSLNNTENIWGANAKFGFSLAGLSGFALGGQYTRGVDSGINATSVYLVHTHRFASTSTGSGLRASLGVNWTTIDFNPGDDNAIRIFGSADYTFSDRLVIGGEIQSKSSRLGESDPLSSVVVRYPIGKTLGIQAGYTNVSQIGLFGTGSHRLFAGVNLGIGGGNH